MFKKKEEEKCLNHGNYKIQNTERNSHIHAHKALLILNSAINTLHNFCVKTTQVNQTHLQENFDLIQDYELSLAHYCRQQMKSYKKSAPNLPLIIFLQFLMLDCHFRLI